MTSFDSENDLREDYDTSDQSAIMEEYESVDSKFEVKYKEYDEQLQCRPDNGVYYVGHDESDDSNVSGTEHKVKAVDPFKDGSKVSSRFLKCLLLCFPVMSVLKGQKERKDIAILQMITVNEFYQFIVIQITTLILQTELTPLILTI